MEERIVEQLAGAGIIIDHSIGEVLAQFLDLLLKWNAVHNLTAITDRDEMIQRHLIESLALRPLLKGERIADVGSGAGLPGIPLAIAEPGRQFTLIESRGKKVRFLQHVQGALGLENVSVRHSRVEDLLSDPPFDTVLARAVAALPELVRLTSGLFARHTVLVALTGESFDGEVAELEGGFVARRVAEPIAKLLRGTAVIVEMAGD